MTTFKLALKEIVKMNKDIYKSLRALFRGFKQSIRRKR
jgi:hypothetical protein